MYTVHSNTIYPWFLSKTKHEQNQNTVTVNEENTKEISTVSVVWILEEEIT